MLAESEYDEGNDIFGESIKGFKWKLANCDPRLITTFCQKLDIPEVLAKILINRDVSDIEEAKLYLDPKIKDLMPNPFDLKDMEKAAKRMAEAVVSNEKITVYGDYDVDGATSSALLRRFFRDLGLDIGVYIPNRMKEGYGPNAESLKKLKDEGNTLVVTVDCGAVSFEPLKAAKEHGLEVIVLDHHLGAPELPDCYAVVNPNRFDEDFPHKSIAAVGVTFLAIVAVRAKLREMKWFEYNPPEPDLMSYIDLVALGTVCDVMALKGMNRAFVAQGLRQIAKRKNTGIATLCNIAKIDSKPQSYHLGYVLGPRINAGGRVGEGLLGTNLLTTEDSEEAYKIAAKLEELNNDRKTYEALALEEAIEHVEKNKLMEKSMIIAVGHDWHQGILGILASRLKERYNRPAAVVSIVDGIGKGSARSISGIDLGTLLANAKDSGLLLEGGGHAMAGGFSVEEEKVEEFYEYMLSNMTNVEESFEKAKELKLDTILTANGVTPDLVKTISKAAPFGSSNPQPKFALCDVVVVKVAVVGKIHLMVIVKDKDDHESKNTLKCMLFRAADSEIGDFIQSSVGKTIHLAGTAQSNNWDDRKVDFIIEDAAAKDGK